MTQPYNYTPLPAADYSLAPSLPLARSPMLAPNGQYATLSGYGASVTPDYGFNVGTNVGLNANPIMLAPNLGGQINGLSVPTAGQPRSIFDSALQQRNIDGTTSGGYLQAGMGVAQGLGNLYLGMQQYNLAKDSLANNKAQFERQFTVNKGLTNSRLEDRQRARVASNSGAYQSVGDYMNQNGVK